MNTALPGEIKTKKDKATLLITCTYQFLIKLNRPKINLHFIIFLLGWCFYLGFVTVLTSVRIQCRDRFNINGNAFEDFFASLFFYPNVVLQLDETTKNIAIKRTSKTDLKMDDAENGA